MSSDVRRREGGENERQGGKEKEERGARREKGKKNDRGGQGRRRVRGTKYEEKESGATELRRWERWTQSRNEAWEPNPCTRGDEAPLVRKASVTRMGTSVEAVDGKFLGTDEANKLAMWG